MTVISEQKAVSGKNGRSETITRRIKVCLLLTVLLFTTPSAEAQQPKIPRIGFLSAASPSVASFRTEPFRQGLRELGYVEGKTIVIVYRYGERKLDRLSALAAELVRLKVAVIVTSGPIPTRAVKEATSTIPIVFAFDSDPVENGFVASLARPGGNFTGLSNLAPEISGKRLELRVLAVRLCKIFIFPSFRLASRET
jgi:ABC-type uncharacterized transport system substrate-binding protein